MAAESPVRVAFDTNTWISFAIGKRLDALAKLLERPEVETFRCAELEAEVIGVINRPRLARFISPERRDLTLRLLLESTRNVILRPPFSQRSRDPKDDYLLTLAQQVKLDFLVTGDQDLLVLGRFEQTSIVTFAEISTLL